MKSVRKLIFLSLFFMLAVLSGCASQEEKDRGKEYEALAEPIIKQYVEENYNEYDVKSIRDVFDTKELFESYATNFVRAELQNEEDSFELIYDTDTNKMYSNLKSDDIADKIENNFNDIEGITVKAQFIGKEEDTYDIDFSNYYNTTDLNFDNYKLYLFIKINNDRLPCELYELLDNLSNLDYEAKIVVSEKCDLISVPLYLRGKLDIDDTIDKYQETLVSIKNIDGKIKENIRKLTRIELSDGYIIFDSIKYNIDVKESNTKLGISESKTASDDYKVQISSLSSNNKELELSVFSSKYTNVIYGYNETFETIKNELRTFDILTFTPTYFSTLKIDDASKTHNLVISLFNKEETK